MAEIDMEIDTHPPHVDMEHADEDLIDYEEDFPHQEEQPLETGLGEDQEQPDVAADKEEDNDGGFDTTLGGSADIQEHQESLDSLQESTTGGEADGDVSVELMADDAAEEHQGVQDGGEVDNQGEEPSAPQTNDQDYINDLDFGYEDGQGQGAANVEDAAPNDESQDAESTIVGKQTVETDQDAETHAEISETETKAEEGTAEQRVAHDEDEITWEEGNAEHPQEPGTSETVQGQEGKEAGQNEEREDNTAQDNQEPEDLGSEQHQQTQATEAEAEHSSHADVEVDADATTEANIDAGETKEPNDPEFPLITVQYNGEEFPLISHSSEGFFDNTSILDESIESLLAGFRAELADEVGPEEELVFQVDEAGLEYSESLSREVLSQVTLTQILEVFDLLVKNQDPDGSRGLYTYLLTKPSATKRFELLVESAAAGRGLGDVAHCFETPIPHNTHVAHDVDPWDELAGYESAGDESGENEGQQGEEVEDETEGENAEGYNLDILEEAMLGTAEPEHDTAGELAEGDDAEHLDEEAVKNHELENSGDNEEASLSAAADAELQAPAEAETQDAHQGHESAPQEDKLDLSESLQSGARPAEHDDKTNVDNSAISSATNTVQNDDDVVDNAADVDVGVDLDVSAEATGIPAEAANEIAGDDELGEIDWRSGDVDGAEVGDADAEADEHASNASASGLQKRSHADDELDTADGKDVKRQRS